MAHMCVPSYQPDRKRGWAPTFGTGAYVSLKVKGFRVEGFKVQGLGFKVSGFRFPRIEVKRKQQDNLEFRINKLEAKCNSCCSRIVQFFRIMCAPRPTKHLKVIQALEHLLLSESLFSVFFRERTWGLEPQMPML